MSGDDTSLFHPADLVNLERTEDLFANINPVDGESYRVRYAKKEDGTCIYITMEGD